MFPFPFLFFSTPQSRSEAVAFSVCAPVCRDKSELHVSSLCHPLLAVTAATVSPVGMHLFHSPRRRSIRDHPSRRSRARFQIAAASSSGPARRRPQDASSCRPTHPRSPVAGPTVNRPHGRREGDLPPRLMVCSGSGCLLCAPRAPPPCVCHQRQRQQRSAHHAYQEEQTRWRCNCSTGPVWEG